MRHLRASSFVFKRRHGHLQEGRKAPSVSRARITTIGDGDVVIAAITSCTNTSNPGVLIAAGLVAARRARWASPKPWVKTSLAPGSQVVTDYLNKAGLQSRPRRHRLQPRRLWLHHLHRQLRPAAEPISKAINDNDLVAAAVLSGNRNFEGRVSPTCARTTSPRRRWSSPMRWPAR
jgi:aconitate hydratase